jgi:hypothetical protein
MIAVGIPHPSLPDGSGSNSGEVQIDIDGGLRTSRHHAACRAHLTGRDVQLTQQPSGRWHRQCGSVLPPHVEAERFGLSMERVVAARSERTLQQHQRSIE